MTIPPIQLLLFICLLFCILFSANHSEAVVSSGNLVTYLPGLAIQPLPFHLETGYIGVGGGSNSKSSSHGDSDDEGANQLFYYFFKSERKEAPLVLWLTGGPRCSGLSPLVFNRGPIQIDKVVEYKNGTSLPTFKLNPYSWTKIANMIFLDEPVGTGFSYYSKSSHDQSQMGDILSARNTYEFLVKWLIQNPEFQSNPVYISGDSYSGIIIPIIVQDLIRDIEVGKYPFLNFKGYSLGNPVTYRRLEENSFIPFARNLGFVSYELYQSMRVNCRGNFLNFDISNGNCSDDRREFEELVSGINRNQVTEPLCHNALTTSPNPKEMLKNRRRRSLVTTREGLHAYDASCPRMYTYVLLEHWANDNRVRKALHVKEVRTVTLPEFGSYEKWNRCNYDLPYTAEVTNAIEYHQNISPKGYRSFIYSGDHDMIVPHISTEAWIRTLANLSITEEWRPWFVDGQVAGYTRTYSNGLTYATVKGSGHTAPEYTPKECLNMFERWFSNTPL
ncbi:serine carboxypeptidase-like 18 [Papaver somniferum]|uniref:serine carboxypeptidase-like 18 n=1 Tax=Papaver somniferum TaxID=3469 RepID=UPI000E701A10|nr:serine carboxypeptidase-like 18 [Papaver somniferum]